MKQQAIILFDGDCSFCHKSVRFIIEHDPEAYFSFASLQGSTGNELKAKHHIPADADSIVLIENNTCYYESTAVLRIGQKLSGVSKLAVVFFIVPKPLRDFIYRIVAKRRHHIVKNRACPRPTSEQQKRFLD